MDERGRGTLERANSSPDKRRGERANGAGWRKTRGRLTITDSRKHEGHSAISYQQHQTILVTGLQVVKTPRDDTARAQPWRTSTERFGTPPLAPGQASQAAIAARQTPTSNSATKTGRGRPIIAADGRWLAGSKRRRHTHSGQGTSRQAGGWHVPQPFCFGPMSVEG